MGESVYRIMSIRRFEDTSGQANTPASAPGLKPPSLNQWGGKKPKKWIFLRFL